MEGPPMMSPKDTTRASKFLSLVLRHQPETAGIELDSAGWVAIDELLAGCSQAGRPLTREQLDWVVKTNPKQRFAISDDHLRIRANQGHSVRVELGYEPSEPPPRLYHGTVSAHLAAIEEGGLKAMSRHHVHLSPDEATARVVGRRRGEPIILRIDAAAMHAAGYLFYRSDNGVWLTDQVPARFIAVE